MRRTPKRRTARLTAVCAAAFGLVASATFTQSAPEPSSPAACAAILADSDRLACYDQVFPPVAPLAEEVQPAAPADLAEPTELAEASTANEPKAKSLLDSRWELLPTSKLGTFGLRAYQPVYVLPWVGSLDPNETPHRGPEGSESAASENLDHSELKFQISWKTKVWQGVFGDVGDLWVGYTQSSRWQVYNAERSRPFRETNYEPELSLVFPTRYHLFGWDGHLLAIGLDHESNGRDGVRSRGWNRVIGNVGLERAGWTINVRPWWRIPESGQHDDNPDIEDYIGRADLLLVRHAGHHELTALVRHSLRGGERSRGAVRLDWAFPIRGNLRGHAQLFHGYGESLIDYNFRTTQLGLGISLVEWY